MTNKIKDLSPRQQLLLTKLSEGIAPGDAGRAAGYTAAHVSRLQRRPDVQAELLRLRACVESQLAEALPNLVADALDILKKDLQSPVWDIRRKAAFFILKNLGKPFLNGLTQDPAENAGETLIIETSPTTAQGSTHDTVSNFG